MEVQSIMLKIEITPFYILVFAAACPCGSWNIELVTPPVNSIVQDAIWDAKHNVLLYTDFFAGSIYGLNLTNYVVSRVVQYVGGTAGPLYLAASNRLYVASGAEFKILDLGNGVIRGRLVLQDYVTQTTVIVNGQPDNYGRVWAGTYQNSSVDTQNCVYNPKIKLFCAVPNQGKLIKLERAETNTPIISFAVENLNGSSGITFNADYSNIYFVNEFSNSKILGGHYDSDNGLVSDLFVFFDLSRYGGYEKCFLNGLTTDTNNNVWVSVFGGGVIFKINPDGTRETVIQIPALQVGALAWGGTSMNVLFVGTGTMELDEVDLTNYPNSGSVFALTNLGEKGLSIPFADLNLYL